VRRKLSWSFLLLFIIISPLIAAELSINAYVDKTTLGLDDVLRFTVEITGENAGQVSQPELPNISGFSGIGTSTSSSSSISIVNGRMTSSVTKSFVYRLKPQEIGVHLIPPISLQHDDFTLTTDPIKITVVEGSTQPPPVSRQFRDSPPDQGQITDNIFIKAETSKETAFRGEPIVVNYRLYSRYDLANLSYVNEPNFVGFWKDDVFFANRMNFQRTNYQGVMYQVMTLRTVVLSPNQTGSLNLPSLEINAEVIIRPRTFFDFDSTKRVNVASEPVILNIRDLPSEGIPENFTGAVGSYRISSDISNTDLTVGDTITYTLTITGSGNLKHFESPPFPQLSFARLIEPETVTDTKLEGKTVVGSRVIRYPVIVHQEGSFTLPPITFSYFDPNLKSYQSLTTSEYQISVAPSNMRIVPYSVAQQDVIPEGADISYIYRSIELSSPTLVINSYLYWLFWILAILTIPFAYYYRKERDKLATDANYVRKKQSRKILQKYLQNAIRAAKEGNMEFYTYVNAGLSNYLTDNLKIARGSTNERIIAEMEQQNYPAVTIQSLKEIINRCLEARFKPGGFDSSKISEDYEKVKEVITNISRQQRNEKKHR